MSLENVVRPFESGSVTPPQNVPSAQIVRIKNAVINPGSGGAVKTMSGSFNLTVTFYMINKPTETEGRQDYGYQYETQSRYSSQYS